jgi:hypothetical protein
MEVAIAEPEVESRGLYAAVSLKDRYKLGEHE